LDYSRIKNPRGYKLKLEAELMERIKQSAQPKFRSINREIELRLRESFDRERKRACRAARELSA